MIPNAPKKKLKICNKNKTRLTKRLVQLHAPLSIEKNYFTTTFIMVIICI